jgi:6-phosphogluconolactonase
MNWKIYDSPAMVIRALCDNLLALSRGKKTAHVSLSGGSTPKLWFAALAEPACAGNINWDNLHFWWGDERCVPPEDPESNFGSAYELLLRHVNIPAGNIHRIHGEEKPEIEAQRYAGEIDEFVPKNADGVPAFDWIILGMGGDGHTASLFPGQTDFADPRLTFVATQPESGQLRISKTVRLLEAADRISYLVLGKSKAKLLKEIRTKPDAASCDLDTLPWPAARIRSTDGITEWYLDSAAAMLMS